MSGGEQLRVAAYCRVSTAQDDQLHSLEHQRRYFAEYISRRPDWALVEIYADRGLSGTTVHRPAFQQMCIRDRRSAWASTLCRISCSSARSLSATSSAARWWYLSLSVASRPKPDVYKRQALDQQGQTVKSAREQAARIHKALDIGRH